MLSSLCYDTFGIVCSYLHYSDLFNLECCSKLLKYMVSKCNGKCLDNLDIVNVLMCKWLMMRKSPIYNLSISHCGILSDTALTRYATRVVIYTKSNLNLPLMTDRIYPELQELWIWYYEGKTKPKYIDHSLLCIFDIVNSRFHSIHFEGCNAYEMKYNNGIFSLYSHIMWSQFNIDLRCFPNLNRIYTVFG